MFLNPKYQLKVHFFTSKCYHRCPICEQERKQYTDSDGNTIKKGATVSFLPIHTAKLAEQKRLAHDGDPPDSKRAKTSWENTPLDAGVSRGTVLSVGTENSYVFCPEIPRVVSIPTPSLNVVIEQVDANNVKKVKPENIMGPFLGEGCLVSILCEPPRLKKMIAQSKQEDILTCSCDCVNSISAKPGLDCDIGSAHSKQKSAPIKVLDKTDGGEHPETGRVITHEGDVHFVLLRRTSRIVRCRRACLSAVSVESGSAICLLRFVSVYRHTTSIGVLFKI